MPFLLGALEVVKEQEDGEYVALALLTFEDPDEFDQDNFPSAIAFVDPYEAALRVDPAKVGEDGLPLDERLVGWVQYFGLFANAVLDQNTVGLEALFTEVSPPEADDA